MSRFVKVTLLVLVLALLVAGLPVGMPMGPGVMCLQCVLASGLVCALAVLLSVAVLVPACSGGRVRWSPDRLRAWLWACPIEHPPQALPSLALR